MEWDPVRVEMERRPPPLELRYGGAWCDCITKVIQQITPKKLAAYCNNKGYREQHKPDLDEIGLRWGYYLYSVNEKMAVGEKDQIDIARAVCAAFGEFFHRDYESLQSCLSAIMVLAGFEKRSPQAVAEDVIACKEEDAPMPEEKKEAPNPYTLRSV